MFIFENKNLFWPKIVSNKHKHIVKLSLTFKDGWVLINNENVTRYILDKYLSFPALEYV